MPSSFLLPSFLLLACSACESAARQTAKKADPDLTFHATPAPLPKDAVTSDWPTFLGPTHDGKSTETRLLKKWPNNGPRLIWERATGTGGFASPAVEGAHLVHFYRDAEREHVICVQPETG